MTFLLLAALVSAPSAKDLADKLHGSVVEIRSAAPLSFGSAAPLSFGTGVLLGGTLALTTLHSVAHASEGKLLASDDIEVFVPDVGPVKALLRTALVDLDLAVLELAEPAGLALTLAPDEPAEGEPLLLMGAGEAVVIALGVRVAHRAGDGLLLEAGRFVDSRFWGGPLFDAQGRLAGILVTSIGQPHALAISALRDLLQR